MQQARMIGVALLVAGITIPASAAINLEFRPLDQTVFLGDTVSVELYAVSDSADSQSLSGLDAIFGWETGFLGLIGLDDTGSVPDSSAFFPDDPFGINESNPPADGDGLVTYFAPFSGPVMATPEGTLITTLQFEALALTASTPVDLLLSAGDPMGTTRVFDGAVPGMDVLGTISGATVQIIPAPGALFVLASAGVIGLRRRRR